MLWSEGGGRITAGRGADLARRYAERVRRHRAEIRAETDRIAWSFTIHRTDRPASDLLLALHSSHRQRCGGRDAFARAGRIRG